MTIIEHLSELRYRMVVSALAFFVGSVVAYIFYRPILDLLKLPLDEGGTIAGFKVNLSVRGVTSAFLVRIKVSIFAGLIFALPVILFQLWRFITPGLEPKEKRYALPFVGGSLGLFTLGAVFAYLTLPQAIGFLLGFAQGLQPIIFIDEYVGFVMFMVLAFGITFELPMILLFLGMAGIVSSARLRRMRRHAVVASAVIAAVATPSQDPYTLVLMAVPLYLMYEAAVLIIRFIMKK
ncbi:MAG: twin-arginine translocase subunit TatC [Actinomycetota bacterium]